MLRVHQAVLLLLVLLREEPVTAMAIVSSGTVAPVFGGGGITYTDCSPRIPVTAITLMDTCWQCSWVVFRETGEYRWSLKAVHGRCPDHKDLRRSYRH